MLLQHFFVGPVFPEICPCNLMLMQLIQVISKLEVSRYL